MRILAIDTATEACSAALYVEGEAVNNGVTMRYQLAPREHSRLILNMIEELLAQADITVSSIDAIAFGRGPGSFMGLRIAAGVVQGIAFAHGIPVIPISTLQAIAMRAYEQTGNKGILVAIDARMDEVYWAQYSLDGQSWSLQGAEQVISPDKINLAALLSATEKEWTGAGTGWASYADRLIGDNGRSPRVILDDCFPSAEVIAKLAAVEFSAGNTVPASEAIPVYLRNDVARKPKPVVL